MSWLQQSNSRRGKRQSEGDYTFVVGDSECEGNSGYCNGPVFPESTYKVKLATCTAGGCVVTAYAEPDFETG